MGQVCCFLLSRTATFTSNLVFTNSSLPNGPIAMRFQSPVSDFVLSMSGCRSALSVGCSLHAAGAPCYGQKVMQDSSSLFSCPLLSTAWKDREAVYHAFLQGSWLFPTLLRQYSFFTSNSVSNSTSSRCSSTSTIWPPVHSIYTELPDNQGSDLSSCLLIRLLLVNPDCQLTARPAVQLTSGYKDPASHFPNLYPRALLSYLSALNPSLSRILLNPKKVPQNMQSSSLSRLLSLVAGVAEPVPPGASRGSGSFGEAMIRLSRVVNRCLDPTVVNAVNSLAPANLRGPLTTRQDSEGNSGKHRYDLLPGLNFYHLSKLYRNFLLNITRASNFIFLSIP
ncbi:unnamed protein product [Protopolystoma xenopodis]|uniref:Uncharacterized protein n=1 Tax=Protopolystoma xenopodis TaxID=117903 RepID=A0A3S5B1N4_9PLAT|nr:unnamed protein product [Protopolystoma xenopodis]